MRARQASSGVVLRGHHLLCLLGFRGLGYSQEYTSNMWRIAKLLRSAPYMSVEVRDYPDDICQPCPFFAAGGCAEQGPESEERARERDRAVLRRLGLRCGEPITWAELLSRVKASISSADLPQICKGCRWLPYAYCQEGVEALDDWLANR